MLMLHAGLDLSRKRLDVCLITDEGELAGRIAAPPDADGLRGLVARLAPCGEPVHAVIESMTGARVVHDTLEELGWDVAGTGGAATWCRRSGCPIRGCAASASRRAFACTWSITSRA